MADQSISKLTIQRTLTALTNEVIQDALTKKSSIERGFPDEYAFYRTLVPDEIFNASYLEKSLMASAGKTWQLLARAIINENLGFGAIGHKITGTIKAGRLKRIASTLNALSSVQKSTNKVKPDWKSELAYVLAGEGEPIPVTVVCDVYAEDRDKTTRYAFELKAPLPNSDQTKVSKEKILKLYSMEPLQVDGAYYALPYNPYGRREDYAWSFPARWFNMKEDEVVLIGDEFWEKIGGRGTYQSFIEAVNEIGKGYKDRVYREFLGIEPPTADGNAQL